MRGTPLALLACIPPLLAFAHTTWAQPAGAAPAAPGSAAAPPAAAGAAPAQPSPSGDASAPPAGTTSAPATQPSPAAASPTPEAPAAPAAAPQASASTSAELHPSVPEATSTADRRGFGLGLALGAGFCYAADCSNDLTRKVGVGLHGALEFGVRPHEVIELLGAVALGTHAVSSPVGSADLEGRAGVSSATLGVRVYPYWLSGFDPWVAVLGGFHTYRQSLSDPTALSPQDETRTLQRGVLRLQLGGDYYVTEGLSVGPFVSWDPQLGGRECVQRGDNDLERCTNLREPTTSDRRTAPAPSAQPQFITVGALVRVRL